MDITLRPLNLGEILDRTFQLYRARFLMFVGIASFAAAIDVLFRALDAAALLAAASRHIASASFGALAGLMSLVSAGVVLLALALTLAATTRAVTALYLGTKTGIIQAYSEVRRHWFRYVLVNLCAFLLAWLPAILIFIVFIAAGITFFRTAGLFFLVAMVVALFATAPLGIWMMLRYSLANTACVFEEIGTRKALRRSVLLSKGSRGRIFVALLVVVVAQSILGLVLVSPEMGVLIVRGGQFGHLPILATVYNLVVGFFSNSLCMPLYGIVLTLFYYDARIRKEGFDVEWMMQRSLQPPNAPQTIPMPQVGFEPE